MTVSTAALLQSLKISSKQPVLASGDTAQRDADGIAKEFLNLLHGMRKGSGGETAELETDTPEGSTDTTASEEGEEARHPSVEPEVGAKVKAPSLSGPPVTEDLVSVLKRVAGEKTPAPDGSARNGGQTRQVSGDQLLPPQTLATGPAPAGEPLVAAAPMRLSGSSQSEEPDTLFGRFAVPPEERVETKASGKEAEGLGDKTTAPTGSVKVLRQETHFAPTMRLSPTQQIGERLIMTLADQGEATQTSVAPGPVRTEGPVLKTLEIQLTPVELGTVKVSLRLVGDAVEVAVVASEPNTAELLKQDRQMLDQMLRSTGYKPDAITIQSAGDERTVAASGSSQQSSNDGGGAPQSGAGFGGAQHDGRQAGGRPSDFGRQEEPHPSKETASRSSGDANETADYRDGDVYL